MTHSRLVGVSLYRETHTGLAFTQSTRRGEVFHPSRDVAVASGETEANQSVHKAEISFPPPQQPLLGYAVLAGEYP